LKELFGEKVLLGVGPKVADCVLLYSCGQDEAFPIDVWIAKVLSRSFPRLFVSGTGRRVFPNQGGKISTAAYAKISEAARAHFGQHAGYAQQYLYMAAREGGL
jgi:N-glycosylase/DNA lyase